jgi:uncharacterized protein YdiU (UPF0061 family)
VTALGFDNSYSRLPERFYAPVTPANVSAPRLIAFNRQLASDLGLDPQALEAQAASVFSGNSLAPDAQPIALAYAGHQFGNFVPQLGDGRALLLGEVIDPKGRRFDIQLKGSGPTPFSRRGDGRAALGPVLREYIVSEAMHAMGIPTTRSLAAVTTGESVYREDILPGAVLTRVASSHIRIGTFQFFAARRDTEAIRILVDHVIERHMPDCAGATVPALALLETVIRRQAYLVARWMHVGFIHGVMNTDNMTVSGETIDYGPCAFLDDYDPAKVFSSIDHGGRYAFANQPAIAQWNLARLAETLLPLINDDTQAAIAAATDAIEAFPQQFENFWQQGMRAKLGLSQEQAGDAELIEELLDVMHRSNADFTLTFRRLTDAAEDSNALTQVRMLFRSPGVFDAWGARWQDRLRHDPQSTSERASAMRTVNPVYIPRNHMVERAIKAAINGDFSLFESLHRLLQRPFEVQAGMAGFEEPPQPEERVLQTFCGT